MLYKTVLAIIFIGINVFGFKCEATLLDGNNFLQKKLNKLSRIIILPKKENYSIYNISKCEYVLFSKIKLLDSGINFINSNTAINQFIKFYPRSRLLHEIRNTEGQIFFKQLTIRP